MFKHLLPSPTDHTRVQKCGTGNKTTNKIKSTGAKGIAEAIKTVRGKSIWRGRKTSKGAWFQIKLFKGSVPIVEQSNHIGDFPFKQLFLNPIRQ